jgi:hypothetical protein
MVSRMEIESAAGRRRVMAGIVDAVRKIRVSHPASSTGGVPAPNIPDQGKVDWARVNGQNSPKETPPHLSLRLLVLLDDRVTCTRWSGLTHERRPQLCVTSRPGRWSTPANTSANR